MPPRLRGAYALHPPDVDGFCLVDSKTSLVNSAPVRCAAHFTSFVVGCVHPVLLVVEPGEAGRGEKIILEEEAGVRGPGEGTCSGEDCP